MSEFPKQLYIHHPDHQTPTERRKGVNGVRQLVEEVKIDNFAQYLHLIRVFKESGIHYTTYANNILKPDFEPADIDLGEAAVGD